MNRLTKKEIEDFRFKFWIAWTFLISMPASVITWLFSEGSWWASPSATIICTVLGYNLFENWLKRRQKAADDTLVMCYCGHQADDHGSTYDMDRACYHGESVSNNYSKTCLCSDYTPRFWRMSKRT